ncbi:MAG: hypothetical protein GXZ07_06450 [Firmicutes bacterium]|nr:hypothetical protein [Bacillota bacterium]
MDDYLSDLIFSLNSEQVYFFKSLVRTYNIKTALDLTRGNSDLAVLMAKWGVDVTVLGSSSYSVRRLEEGKKNGLKINVIKGDMRDIYKIYNKRSHLTICLKNSLSRLLSPKDILGTLAQVYLNLEPGGIIVLHTLNYEYLAGQGDLPVFIAEEYDRDLVVRLFFDISTDGKYANLIFKRCLEEETVCEITIPVFPLSRKKINLWLAELGFKRIENYYWLGQKNNDANFQLITTACRP